VFTALERGASGYLLKSADGASLAEQVLDLRQGGSPITPTVARLLVQRLSGNAMLQQTAPAPDAQTADPVLASGEALTAREVQVLNLIAVGYSYAEISNQLHISKHTVNAHIRSSYQKLQVHSRGEAVFEGQRRGLLSTTQR
jgi:DNA-binding NarL/FixJ family response regulator